MGKIVLDRSGDFKKGIFYRFDVPLDDRIGGQESAPDWIIVPRTPTQDALFAAGEEPWIWLAVYTKDGATVETKDCPADPTHITHHYYAAFYGEALGGKRISPLIPAADPPAPFGLSDELKRRIERLSIRGARIDAIDLKDHVTEKKLHGFWALQFVGRIRARILKFVDVPNLCPFCGKSKIVCESCGGDWNGTCNECGNATIVWENEHRGPTDKRIPLERHGWGQIIEGSTWDGSALVSDYAGGKAYASKRVIDWLLRIHAAPFYAEPVYFCVDGMSDQQKKWFDELQKPLDG
jgi:hypothetical protein